MQRASDLFISAEDRARSVGYGIGVVNSLNERALHVSVGEGLQLLEESVLISRQIDFAVGNAIALLKRGTLLRDQRLWNDALKSFKDALSISQNLKRKGLVADAKREIAVVYNQMGDLENASNYLAAAQDIYKERKDSKGLAYCIGNFGLIRLNQVLTTVEVSHNLQDLKPFWNSDLDVVLRYHEQALKIFREISDVWGEANELANVGNLYRIKGEHEKSKARLNEALELHRKTGYHFGEATDLKLISILYLQQKDKKAAREVSIEAYQKFNILNNEHEMLQCSAIHRAAERLE